MKTLKWLLPRLPLPMLALAASYGVYQFALLFVPHWVAVVQAAAFELTYIGLATIEARGKIEQRKATFISLGAVIVSVLYNSLAGYFHRNGLATINDHGEIILAILHGAPLAIVAYLVADLLLHTNQEVDLQMEESVSQELQIEIPVPPALPSLVDDLQEDAREVQEGIEEDAIDVQEPVTLESLLSHLGKTRQEAIAMMKKYGLWNGTPERAYHLIKRFIGLPDNITSEAFAQLFAELQSDLQEDESDLQKPDGVSRTAWEAWQAVQSGKSQSEVADEIDKSVSTVSRYCAKVEEALAA